MGRLSRENISSICQLRREGKTYAEINQHLGMDIKKSTLSYWCSNIALTRSYYEKLKIQNTSNLMKARQIAVNTNKRKRALYLSSIDEKNIEIANSINVSHVSKIALAMLCMGEATKYGKSAFALGNSDPRIIVIFLQLLRKDVAFDSRKLRGTVQCRADQNISELETYWANITNIPKSQFYKAQIDPRTVGKITINANYKGVFRVNYLDTNMQLELESLSNLIYNLLLKHGPVVHR